MSDDPKTMDNKDLEGFLYEPAISELRPEFMQFVERLCKTENPDIAITDDDHLGPFREMVAELAGHPVEQDRIRLYLSESLLVDLVAQGWVPKIQNDNLRLEPIGPANDSKEDRKKRIRSGHLVERDAQLAEPSVSRFISDMERKRLTKSGWHSIFSLMRDGVELGAALAEAAAIHDERLRDESLANIIRPYIQFVNAEDYCEKTGLRLMDIWRYFRHTWTTAYRSIPGRNFQILIRDAAAENHPVIGIAALGSSVVQSDVRDEWIGWKTDQIIERIKAKPSKRYAKWLGSNIDSMIAGIYIDDLLEQGSLHLIDIEYPTEKILVRLAEIARTERERHQRFPDAARHKAANMTDATVCEEKARSHLFRYKRCVLLAELLLARRLFRDYGLDNPTSSKLRKAVGAKDFLRSLRRVIRRIRSEKVGISMMDIIVCGSAAPYSEILGGKLVSMMLASPEISTYYWQKYEGQVSVIASSMAGRPIMRDPTLVFLGTTSLYDVNASQYNRIKIPADQIGGATGKSIDYARIGRSKGYGSFHFSKATIALAEALTARHGTGRKVNSIFGEGVNPLMRKVRDALDIIELPDDRIVKHGNRRLVYGISLVSNVCNFLIGLDKKPKYLFPQRNPSITTQRISAYWRRRWLSMRIQNCDVLKRLERHTLAHPISHGARVRPPKRNEDLFSD